MLMSLYGRSGIRWVEWVGARMKPWALIHFGPPRWERERERELQFKCSKHIALIAHSTYGALNSIYIQIALKWVELSVAERLHIWE